eukprot:CAMPEP_0117658356 /NCGR_PEP_ID=MMETSP0804-20121206/5822_1 /TAXON_ID=1074897 /ORGANISM="Tetraselmis astigmatica, Strain CCMP880" /LENGTH=189 /DNA_ID=CAMNT_0005464875 /DNA_START=149 /DNA_END=715 /DNA_ORIENTATION=-
MVLFFTPRNDQFLLYMGKDKVENEELIAYGLPEDVWFHVDGLSSAHVYVRLPTGHTIDEIDDETLEDCAQLVKANSIQGNKQNNIDIVYTPWSNLKKTPSMDVGQVGFHDRKMVKKCFVEKRSNEIVNRLNKTKREEYPDLKEQRTAYDAALRAERKAETQEQKRKEKKEKEAKKKEQELRSYSDMMQE